MSQIVLVDDDPLTLEALRQPLVRGGHTVIAFEEGGRALDWLMRGRADLVILDIVMAPLSGYEVCRRLRAARESADIPVIFLTSKSRPADIEEARVAGSEHFVTKPVLLGRLLPMVARLLARAPREPK